MPPVLSLEHVGQLLQRRVGAEQIVEHLADRLRAERHQGDLAVVGLRHPIRPVLGAEVDDHQARGPLDRVDMHGEELLGRGVDPVEVLIEADAGVTRDLSADQPLHHSEQLSPAGIGIDLGGGPLRVGHGEEVEQQRQILDQGLVEEQELAGDALAGALVGVLVGDVEVAAHQVHHRHQRNRLGMGETAGVVDGHPLRPPALGELVAEAALPDPRLADDPDHPRLPRPRLLEGLLEDLHLVGAADESCEAARLGDVEPASRRSDPGQLVHAQGAARAPDIELAEIGERQVPLDERSGVLGQVGLAGLGELLHPLGEADRVTDRGVLHPEVLADAADHDLT